MNRDEILEMIVKHIISSRIEEGTDLIYEVYVNDFVDELVEAINYSQCCKSDSELLVCKGRCDHGYMDEFGNELFCSIKDKCAN